MSHLHRQRRGVTPRPSEKDIRLWDRLLKRADVVCRDGHDAYGSFELAAAKASKAVCPVGHQRVDSPFVQLVGAGVALQALTGPAREARLSQIAGWSAECRAVLDGLKPAATPDGKPAPRMRRPSGGRTGSLPFRKDIDG